MSDLNQGASIACYGASRPGEMCPCDVCAAWRKHVADTNAGLNRTPAATTGDGELPPLPSAFMDLYSPTVRKAWEIQMQDYARAAIEADRAQLAEKLLALDGLTLEQAYQRGRLAAIDDYRPVVDDLRAQLANTQHAFDIVKEEANRQAARASAQPADPKRRDIFGICDAYESGIGHGLQRDGHKSGSMFSNPEHGLAYEIGYEEGESRECASYPPRVTPEMVSKLNTTLDLLEKTNDRIVALKAKYGLAGAQPDQRESAAEVINQCDGCRTGAAINVYGNHVTSSGAPFMACQASKYAAAPAAQPDWRALGYVEGATVRQKISATQTEDAVIRYAHGNGALDVEIDGKLYGWSARFCTVVRDSANNGAEGEKA